jgi:hypothetical protein
LLAKQVNLAKLLQAAADNGRNGRVRPQQINRNGLAHQVGNGIAINRLNNQVM